MNLFFKNMFIIFCTACLLLIPCLIFQKLCSSCKIQLFLMIRQACEDIYNKHSQDVEPFQFQNSILSTGIKANLGQEPSGLWIFQFCSYKSNRSTVGIHKLKSDSAIFSQATLFGKCSCTLQVVHAFYDTHSLDEKQN